MVDLTTLTTTQQVIGALSVGALSIAPLYLAASYINKSITGRWLPKTKKAVKVTLVEAVVALAAILPVQADTNLDKAYGIKELIDTAKVNLPYYLPKIF